MGNLRLRSAVCLHEAGHAVAAVLCGFPVEEASVSHDLAHREISLTLGGTFRTGYQACFVLLAGMVAESLAPDRPTQETPIATDDLIRVALILDELYPESASIVDRSEWIYGLIDRMLDHVSDLLCHTGISEACVRIAETIERTERVRGEEVRRILSGTENVRVDVPQWWWDTCERRGLTSSDSERRTEWREIWELRGALRGLKRGQAAPRSSTNLGH